jgi:GDP-4-dehydro-6-deoxy-D-mannose reductase
MQALTMTGASVLITGISGFAGRHLAEHCRSCGDDVAGVSRGNVDVEGLPWQRADLTDLDATERVVASLRPDWVFHLAAEASVVRSWEDPRRIIQQNVVSTLNVLEAVRRHAPATRVLVACSGQEYGQPDWLPVTEDHPLRPQNPYAASKASADLLAGFYNDAHDIDVVRMRAFNHAGPGQSDRYLVSRVAHRLVDAELSSENGGRVEIAAGQPDVRRDFTDVRDVVRAYRMAIENAEPGAYNVCSGRAVTIAEILDGLATHSPLEIDGRPEPSRERDHEIVDVHGSYERLHQATGWRPEIALEHTLRDTLDWWRTKLAGGVLA